MSSEEEHKVETTEVQDSIDSAGNEQLKSDNENNSPALATEGGREISHKILYVGGLVKIITEDDLREIFSINGNVQSVKILNDKNRPGFNYAFVEYDDEEIAENVLNKLDKSELNGSEININFAYQSQQAKNDPNSFNIFVGDLSTEVDDELLRNSFKKYQSLSQAHVMWDMQSGRSRGYGFVSFIDQKDAEDALQQMNGELIANRAIRLNWASHKQQTGFRNFHLHHHNNHHHHHHNHQFQAYQPQQNGGDLHSPQLNNVLLSGSTSNGSIQQNGPPNGINILSPQNYDLVLRKSPSWQTTVYLGNLARFTTQNDLIPLLQNFGFIVDLRFLPEKNCAFIKYDSHERAALAIVQLNGFVINGRPLKSGWGKERPQNLPYQNYPPLNYGQRQ